jgi:hypothetical protein
MLFTLWPNTATSDGEDEDRKSLHVGRAHHEGAERPAPRPLAFVVADHRPDRAADHGRHQGAGHGDGEVDARRVEHAAEDIHAGAVGAQQVAAARRQQVDGGIGGHRVEGHDPGRQRGDHDHTHHDGVAEREARPGSQHGEEETQAPAPRALPPAVGRVPEAAGPEWVPTLMRRG